MKILGIDPSSHLGWVAIDDTLSKQDGIWSGLIHHKPEVPSKIENIGHHTRRLSKYRFDFAHVVKKMQPDMAVIEGYAYGVRTNSAVLINSIGAVCRLILHDFQVPTIEIAPSSVKKFTTGKSQATKSLMLKHVYMVWGFDTNDDNIADAYALARMGFALLDPPMEMRDTARAALAVPKKRQLEILAKVKGT